MGSKIDRKIAEERITRAGMTAAWLDKKHGVKTKNPYNLRTRVNAYSIWQRAYDARLAIAPQVAEQIFRAIKEID